jgi:O-antigen/teichoic acid export membrane protein
MYLTTATTVSPSAHGPSRISRRRAAKINLFLGYSRYTVFVFNQIILVPLYLNFIGIEAYGSWLASGNVVTLLNILDMGFSLVVTQRLATAFGEGDDHRFVQEVGSSLGVVVAGFIFLSAIAFTLAPWIPGWINAPASQNAPLRWAIVLAGIGAGAQVVALSPWAVLQAWQSAFLCEFSLFVSAILGLTATVFFLFRGMAVTAFGVGALVSGGSAAILLLSAVAIQWRRRKLPLPLLDFRGSSELFKYASPVIVSRMALSCVNEGQPVIVSACIGPAAAAILSLTERTFKGCRTLLEPIIGCSFAGIAHLTGISDLHSARVRLVLKELLTIVSLTGAVLLGLAVALNVSFGRLWVGQERFGGRALTIAICLATVALSTNNILGMILTALGNIRGPAWVSLLVLAARVPLMIVLLRQLGIIGAPLAAIASSLVIGSWYLFRLFRRDLSLRTMEALHVVGGGLPALAACLSIAVMAALLSPAPTWWSLIWRGVMMSLALLTLTILLTPFARDKAAQAAVTFLSSLRRRIAA